MLTATVLVVVAWWHHTLGVVGELFVLHHSLLGCPLLEPVDVFWIHWSPPENETRLFWRALILSSPLGFDHGHVFRGLGVLGVQAPLFDLRLILLLANNYCQLFEAGV